MKKAYFVIPALTGGGTERVLLHLLRHINRKKIEPHLILFLKQGELLSELVTDIKPLILTKKEIRYGLQWIVCIKLAKLIKKERPDIIFSFMWYTNLVTLLAKILSRFNSSVIVSERYGLSFSLEGAGLEILRQIGIRFFYPKASKIVVNAQQMKFQLTSKFHFAAKKISLIHNPIDIYRINYLGKKPVQHSWFNEEIPIVIAIGRLVRQKGFSFLVKAIHLIISNGQLCRLIVLGTGKEQEELKKLSINLKIDDKVQFLGFQKNPYKYLTRSTVFVLSSLYEGFPNVLLEALALGIPSVATQCPTGPEEIISHGDNGLLVPPADVKALADSIKRLLDDADLRRRLAEAGKNRAEDFRVKKIVRQYEDLIEKLCAESAEK
jgi:glycosyltransferase involved in cell wall biosynthesis